MHSAMLLAIVAISLPAVSAIEPSILFSRNTVSGGGWALRATSCAPTFQLCGHNDMCCPANTDCINSGTGNHCCAPGTICRDLIAASPQCADDSWSLWNSTTAKSGQGYFCCLPGQVGTNTGSCVAGGSNVVQTLSASLVCVSLFYLKRG
jgi:hypothetical protein